MTSKQESNQATVSAFAIFIVIAALSLTTQEMWMTISGLYFSYAYEMIVLPYLLYALYNLYKFAVGQPANRTKLCLILLAYTLLFAPSAYLWLTNQLSFHAIVFSDFDATLNHLPYAQYLPFIALAALFFPYPDITQQAASSNAGKLSGQTK